MNGQAIFGYVLLIPFGLEGHLTPFMFLARKILERGLSCTLVLEEHGTESLERNFRRYGSLENAAGFNVKLVPSPSLPDSVDDSEDNFPDLLQVVWEPVLQELLQYRREGGKEPKCMIVDQFAGWTNGWAKELDIPKYVFSLSATTFVYWMYRFSALIQKDNLLERVDEDPVLDLPGAPKIRLSEAEAIAVYEPGLFTSVGDTFDDAAGILINSFYELEASVIDNFRSQLDAAGGIQTRRREQSKVLPIGPLAHPKSLGHAAFDVPEKDSKCIQWLDTRSPGSVIYIAFGSMAALSRAQIVELANALENTKVNFLWILRALPDEHDETDGFPQWLDGSKFFPQGFQERTKDYGLVHPYFAPQLQILEHPSTGAFLTHCGWNSALESISSGIPLIGWPKMNEQLLCCRVLEHAGVAARIRPEMTREGDLLKSAELERAIRTWMMEGPGRTQLKEKVLELQHRASEAVAPGGSSYQNFEGFILKLLPNEKP